MADKTILFLVGTRCRPELEAKFNKWYNEVHIPMLLKFKGMQEVTRYRLLDAPDKYPAYLAVYKFDSEKAYQAFQASPELAAARQDMAETWKEGDIEMKWRVHYQHLQTWKK